MDFGEIFLQTPELFPGRQSGDAWGEQSMAIDFVGGPYIFHGLDAPRKELFEGWFEDCSSSLPIEQLHGIETQVFRVRASEFLEYDPAHWETILNIKSDSTAVSIAGLKYMARIELHPVLRGAIWMSCEDDILDELAFKNYFRILAAYRLHLLGGAMLHSAAIVKDGGGYVFIGESGAGKTTLSKACIQAGLEVLSDDLNAIIPHDGQLVVKKVPFSGTLDRKTSALTEVPLRQLGMLQKGTKNSVDYSGSTRAQAVASLIASVPFVNCDPHQFDLLLSNIDKFLLATPLVTANVRLGGDPRDLLQ